MSNQSASPVGREVCRRCGHHRHLGRCYTQSVYPEALAHLAPAHAVPGARTDHLEGTLVASCDCTGTLA